MTGEVNPDPKTFALRLRRRGFHPVRTHGDPAYPPIPIHCNLFPHKYSAFLLSTEPGRTREYLRAFENAATADDVSRYTLEDHPTKKRLGTHYPFRAASEITKNQARFIHYERIGIYDNKKQLAGIAHIRHILTCDPGFSYYEPPKKMSEGYPHYKIQILDCWFASETMQGADRALASAVASTALDHLSTADGALLDLDDTDENPTANVYWLVSVQAEKDDLMSEFPQHHNDATLLAGIVAGYLFNASVKFFEDNIGLYFSRIIPSIALTPLSPDDIKDIDGALKSGKAIEPKPQKPKGTIAELQHLIPVPDKFFVTTTGNKIRLAKNSRAGRPLMWLFLLEEVTRLFYVEPVLTATPDIHGFLRRAWEKKDNLIFEGKPGKLSIAKRHMNQLPGIEEALLSEGVELLHPRSGFASGIRNAASWADEVENLAENHKEPHPPDVSMWCTKQQVVIAGNGWFKERDYNAYQFANKAFGNDRIATGYLTFTSFVDTKGFAAAVGRTNAEDVIRANWPTDNKK